jgi:hypothetical protein
LGLVSVVAVFIDGVKIYLYWVPLAWHQVLRQYDHMRRIFDIGQPDFWYLDIIYPVTIFDAAAMILDDISFLEKAVALALEI